MLSPVEALERFECRFSLFFFQKQNLVFEQTIFFEIFCPTIIFMLDLFVFGPKLGPKFFVSNTICCMKSTQYNFHLFFFLH